MKTLFLRLFLVFSFVFFVGMSPHVAMAKSYGTFTNDTGTHTATPSCGESWSLSVNGTAISGTEDPCCVPTDLVGPNKAACSTYAGSYDIPPTDTMGNASYTYNSCTFEITAYTGGCYAPTCANGGLSGATACPTCANGGIPASTCTPTCANGGITDPKICASTCANGGITDPKICNPTCANGGLSGATACPTCANGGIPASTCTPTCANGGIDGATCCGNGYSNYPTCWVAPATCTTPWGSTINNGVWVYAFNAAQVTSPASCGGTNQEQRTCSDGNLGGSYTNMNCTVLVPTITSFTVAPTRVRSSGAVTIKWSTTDVTSCSVKKNGVARWSGTSSSGTSDTITGQTTYTITCDSLPSQSVTVNVVPVYQEF